MSRIEKLQSQHKLAGLLMDAEIFSQCWKAKAVLRIRGFLSRIWTFSIPGPGSKRHQIRIQHTVPYTAQKTPKENYRYSSSRRKTSYGMSGVLHLSGYTPVSLQAGQNKLLDVLYDLRMKRKLHHFNCNNQMRITFCYPILHGFELTSHL